MKLLALLALYWAVAYSLVITNQPVRPTRPRLPGTKTSTQRPQGTFELRPRNTKSTQFGLGKGKGNQEPKVTLHFPNYPAPSQAARQSAVEKYYDFQHKNDPDYNPEMTKLNTVPSLDNFNTEHVYEGQTLGRFFDWLIEAGSSKVPFPTVYGRPNQSWMKNILNPENLNGQNDFQFSIPSQGPQQGPQSLWFHIRKCVGSRENYGGLVLAAKGMNYRKGVLFGGKNPQIPGDGDQLNDFRNVAGVFYYMGIGEIWTKFTTTSHCIEGALAEFDRQFPWRRAEAPGRQALQRPLSPLNAGLRTLYRIWISGELASIEGTAEQWIDLVNDYIRRGKGKSSSTLPGWLNRVRQSETYSKRKLKFRKGTGQRYDELLL
ncbi:uncharacterized protein E0L32_006083 [Thyridium curvatum]|uniref:Enterotoxin n=1 Tax=Thyridium curvatum TaxID=1093900 RepID=A0A507AUG3_9PEZI|nr:uncharacterized protein E0L32_006083 [Thyridium curvatum]TPX13612.1 hypothetical protein E0L32_006083 [Thyridium curvatum]